MRAIGFGVGVMAAALVLSWAWLEWLLAERLRWVGELSDGGLAWREIGDE